MLSQIAEIKMKIHCSNVCVKQYMHRFFPYLNINENAKYKNVETKEKGAVDDAPLI